MPVIVRNTADVEEVDDIDMPRRSDGMPYRFELVAGTHRVYDDTADGLLSALIAKPFNGISYADADADARLAMRVEFAVRVQVQLQAAINSDFDLGEECGVWEQAILTGPRDEQPVIEEWASDVPLVLVDYFYEPYPDGHPRPFGKAPVAESDNLIWLSPEDPYDLLVTLHDSGAVTLFEAIEAVA